MPTPGTCAGERGSTRSPCSGSVPTAVASVGRRPTVKENAAPLLEVHLFDWNGDLYGRHLRVTFLHKLRDEQKYDSLDALRAAIGRDADQAKDYFRKHG